MKKKFLILMLMAILVSCNNAVLKDAPSFSQCATEFAQTGKIAQACNEFANELNQKNASVYGY